MTMKQVVCDFFVDLSSEIFVFLLYMSDIYYLRATFFFFFSLPLPSFFTVTFYHDKYKENRHSFRKPDEVLHFERERNTWQVRYRDSHLLEKEGPWETRKDGPAPTEKERKEAEEATEEEEEDGGEGEGEGEEEEGDGKKKKNKKKKKKKKKKKVTLTWWTNIENCKVFKERPAGMDEARVRRKRHEALTREQSLLEWDELRSG